MGLTCQVHLVQLFLCHVARKLLSITILLNLSSNPNSTITNPQFNNLVRNGAGGGGVPPPDPPSLFYQKICTFSPKTLLTQVLLVHLQSCMVHFQPFRCKNTIFCPYIYEYIPYSLPCHVCPVGRMSSVQSPDGTCCSCWSRKYFCPIIDQLRYSYLPLRLCDFKTCFDLQRHKGWFALRARRNQLQNLIRVVTVVGCSCSKAMGNAMTGNTGR